MLLRKLIIYISIVILSINLNLANDSVSKVKNVDYATLCIYRFDNKNTTYVPINLMFEDSLLCVVRNNTKFTYCIPKGGKKRVALETGDTLTIDFVVGETYYLYCDLVEIDKKWIPFFRLEKNDIGKLRFDKIKACIDLNNDNSLLPTDEKWRFYTADYYSKFIIGCNYLWSIHDGFDSDLYKMFNSEYGNDYLNYGTGYMIDANCYLNKMFGMGAKYRYTLYENVNQTIIVKYAGVQLPIRFYMGRNSINLNPSVGMLLFKNGCPLENVVSKTKGFGYSLSANYDFAVLPNLMLGVGASYYGGSVKLSHELFNSAKESLSLFDLSFGVKLILDDL